MASGRYLYLYSTLVGIVQSWRPVRHARRILIYKLDHIGDLLIATPTLRAIRQRFPEAEIKIVIGEWNLPVIENNPNVDEVLIYNSGRFARHPYVPHSFRNLKRQLGGWKPDLVIGLRDDWATLSDSLFSMHRRLERGRAHFKEWLWRYRSGDPYRHELHRLWETLRPLGIESLQSNRLEYFVTDAEQEKAFAFMADRGIGTPFALVHSGATLSLREWPLERFAECARYYAEVHGMQIVLIGVGKEVERSRALAAMLADIGPVDISGALDLRATAALMKHASLYIGSDGGAMHLAAAVGVPTVGLFGPGSYHVFHPVGEMTAGISHHFPCSPCNQTECVRPHDTCMQAISVEEVIAQSELLLSRVEQEDLQRT